MQQYIVYGAGKVGKALYKFLEQQNRLDLVYAFCDKNYETLTKTGFFEKTTVDSYEKLKGLGLPFVIGVGEELQSEVEQILKNDGIEYIESCFAFIEELWSDNEERLKKLADFFALRYGNASNKPVKLHGGECPFCGRKTIFVAFDFLPSLRETYRCLHCGTSPRQRALFVVLNKLCPNWRELAIHESSPSGPVSAYISKECHSYTSSFYYEDRPLGINIGKNITNQNLEKMTFDDETFDLIITQDVMEHVNEPDKVASEISRVLKKGGRHIFTVPTIHGKKTFPRIKVENGKVINIAEPIYHGNPISEDGALVTYDWGDDMMDFIDNHANIKRGGALQKHICLNFLKIKMILIMVLRAMVIFVFL